MSGFPTLADPSPLLNLVVGLLLFCGCSAVGRMLIVRGPLRNAADADSPWFGPILSTVAGITAFCAGSNWLGWLQIADQATLIGWLIAWLLVGLVAAVVSVRKTFNAKAVRLAWSDAPLILVAVCLLICASVVSTKIDELYYHMLAPARFALTADLEFHRYPWQSALPQMYFQIGLTPLHMVGLPHTGNVLSACIGIRLAIGIRELLFSRSNDPVAASLISGLVLFGIHASVLYITSAAHALGDLCVATAVLMQCCRVDRVDRSFSAHTGLLLAVAACTKVSLVPLAGMLSALHVWRYSQSVSQACLRAVWVALPWMVVWLPNVLWTWLESGSPFGPLLAGKFGSTVYDVQQITQTLSSSRGKAQQIDLTLLQQFTTFPLLFWWLAVRGLRSGLHWRSDLYPAAFCFIFQMLTIVALLPYAQRFLGGTQIALMVAGAVSVLEGGTGGWLRPETLKSRTLLLLTVAPWIPGQAIYLSPFLQRGVGAITHEEFSHRFIPFYDDLRHLDQQLPAEATILTVGVRPPSVYFPRSIVVRSAELTAAIGEQPPPVYVFACDLDPAKVRERLPDGLTLQQVVWHNPAAVKYTSRVPGIDARTGDLTVYATAVDLP